MAKSVVRRQDRRVPGHGEGGYQEGEWERYWEG